MMHYIALLLPPPKVRAALDRVRRRCDPYHAAIIPAHVTVGGTVYRKGLARFTQRLKKVAAATRPFKVKLGAARLWPDVVYLPVFPRAPLKRLREALGFGMKFRQGQVKFHLTLAYKLGDADTRRVHRELKGKRLASGFTVDRITVLKLPFDDHEGHGRAKVHLEARLAGKARRRSRVK